MHLDALGYVVVAASGVEAWQSFATRLLGMDCLARPDGKLALRMDAYAQRLLVDTRLPRGRHHCGWEVADAATLSAVAARVEAAGHRVIAEPEVLAQARGVRELISFSDPAGNRVEIFHGPHLHAAPFEPSRAISGFRTGALGLGHAVLTVADAAPMLAFYTGVLGFRLSDYMLRPFRAYFLHTNPRHHSLAFIETGNNGLHHVMVELMSLDDVGQCYDLALEEEQRIGVTLGRHSNDHMVSFYARTPSDFMLEYGWGGRKIDPASWQAQELTRGPSLWGHERSWLPPDQRREARDLRVQAAADGFREPVHVLPGNHTLMSPG